MSIAEQLTTLDTTLTDITTEITTQSKLISDITSLVEELAGISDLTNTYWMFNDEIDLTTFPDVSIAFSSDYGLNSTEGSAYSNMFISADESLYYTHAATGYRQKAYDIRTLQYGNSAWYTNKKVIKILGGTGTTDKTFIRWLCMNAKPLIKKLAGTTWHWNSNVDSLGNASYNIRFLAGNNNQYSSIDFNYIEADDANSEQQTIRYDYTRAYDTVSGGWVLSSMQTITIVDEGDADLALRMCLACNATLVKETASSTNPVTSEEEQVSVLDNTQALQDLFNLLNVVNSWQT